MLCKEFLERHTEFRDGLITFSRELHRFARHMAHCTTCRRYDATIREAVQALHAASPIAPSRDFRQRLDARHLPENLAEPLLVEDRDVEVIVQLGQLEARKKFNLKDMVYKGKLEL